MFYDLLTWCCRLGEDSVSYCTNLCWQDLSRCYGNRQSTWNLLCKSNAPAVDNQIKHTQVDCPAEAPRCDLLFWPSETVITAAQTSLQCDADGFTVWWVHPTHLSVFVIGCLALLTCLFFTSLQQHIVNQTLLCQPCFTLWLCLLSPDGIFMRPSILHQRPDISDHCGLPHSFIWI